MDIHEQKLIDIRGPRDVEIVINADGTTIWVNIEGMCMFRAQNVENLVLDDDRNRRH